MSRTLKWVLGIVIGVIVVVGLVAVGYFAFTHWSGVSRMVESRAVHPFFDDRNMPYRDMPMRPFNRQFGEMPGMRIVRFSPLGWIFGGLVKLGLLALIVVGSIVLIRSLWRSRPAAVQPVQSTPVAAQPVQPAPVETQTAEVVSPTCPNCGFAVQEGWKHCPNCAHDLSQ